MTTKQWHYRHYESTRFETHPQHWSKFIEIDPFNTVNQVEGYVQMKGGDEYGALDIREVNGVAAPQFILTTPKTQYPFFKDGTWVLQNATAVEAFIKVDGTNVCQYGYHDAGGRAFTSFKTRTRPFMSLHFHKLLNRCLDLYPGVRGRELLPGEALIYEMYGYDNPMIIQYSAAARNVFEVTDDPTDQDLIQLLAEDWSAEQINNSMYVLRAINGRVTAPMRLAAIPFTAGSRSSCQPSALCAFPGRSVAPSQSPNWLNRKRG